MQTRMNLPVVTLTINTFRKKSTISFKVSRGISVSCTALLKFMFLIFVRAVFSATGEK